MNLSYDEGADALTARIRAHRQFSSLKIEDVLQPLIERGSWRRILDIGCGSGNFAELFARNCTAYVGIDKNAELLTQAQRTLDIQGLRNAIFMRADMDQPFLFLPRSFDLVFYGFSAYYSSDVASLVQRSEELLDNHGTLCLVGPLAGNGIELDRITERLFRIPFSPMKDARLNRLGSEFLPVVRRAFTKCEIVEKDFSVLFPSIEEYTRYYCATPQYLELARREGAPPQPDIAAAVNQVCPNLTLTKRAIFIWAEKN